MSQLVEDLKAARALIDTPEKWCKGVLVRPIRQWNSTASNARPAVLGYAACTIGAVANRGACKNIPAALDTLQRVLPADFYSLEKFNDAASTSHADIMALFDRAIKAAEAA